ncbi:AI-2E family transporter [Peribacillus sp. SCS-155]|uniref:AI-2E family transporter n=1 Tax=Peribacillus sedimenti TaxID=3115297 RepID=UPI0039058EB9
MEIRMKWFYRLGFLLLLFIVIYIFIKLKLLWLPVITIILTALLPFFLAAFISYLLYPVVEALHGQGLNRGLSIVIIYLLFFGGVGLAVYKGVPVAIGQVRDFSENAPYAAEQYRKWVMLVEDKTSSWPFGIHERLENGIITLEQRMDRLMTIVMDYVMRAVDFFLLFALIPFIAFYMLKDIESIKKMVWYLTPRRWRRQGIAFLNDVDASLGGYIRGQLLVCAAIGLASTAVFWFIGMDYPLLLGSIIGATNIIPYFGPLIGAVPAVLVAAAVSGKMVLTVVAVVLALQFLEGNVLSPLIVGKSLHMHPLFIMFALLLGGQADGIPGLMVAVPILAIIKVFILHARLHFMKKIAR